MIWLQGLLCGALVTLATPTALLLGVLLGPALLALLLDRQPGRPKGRSVALFAMAAAVNPLRILWASGHSIAIASSILANPRVLGIAWSAAATGWLLAEITPIGVRVVQESLLRSHAARLRTARARLVEEWGFEPRSGDQ
jgi:hypothetical protein